MRYKVTFLLMVLMLAKESLTEASANNPTFKQYDSWVSDD